MEQRNMILAFVLSLAILVGWSTLFPPEKSEAPASVETTSTATPGKVAATLPETAPAPVENVTKASSEAVPSAEGVIAQGQTFSLGNDLLKVQVNDKGWLTNVTLLKYRESIEPGSPNVAVLSSGDQHRLYVNDGLIGASASQPFHITKQDNDRLVLQTQLNDGREWVKTITLQKGSYSIDVQDRISNGAGLKMYRQAVERHPDTKLNTFYEHVGPIALINDKLQEIDYKDLDEKGQIQMAGVGGWVGIMNRYFITAMIANKGQDYPYYFKSDGRSYQSGLIDDGKLEGKDAVFQGTIFVGPKSMPILENLNVGLERSIDFGWFAFMSKPMHSFLLWMYKYIGNFGWCIILLVVMIKLLFFWPTQKSYESMAAMRKLQPEMARLKDLYGDDRQQMSQEMMKLYKKHQVNPLGGCLPIAVQIPVFFALYKVLLMSIELRQAPFIGWIHDMSVKDPYFVLPVLMGLSMFVQQRLNPQPSDPTQAKIMQFLPPIFTVMFLFFPSGLVLYWMVNNILSIAQQWYVLKVKKAL